MSHVISARPKEKIKRSRVEPRVIVSRELAEEIERFARFGTLAQHEICEQGGAIDAGAYGPGGAATAEARGEANLTFLPNDEQVLDVLTKTLPGAREPRCNFWFDQRHHGRGPVALCC